VHDPARGGRRRPLTRPRIHRLLPGLALALLLLANASTPPRASAAVDAAAAYRERCAVCHGSTGRGDGPAAGLLAPRPRDFTSGRYKFRSSATGTLPLVADVEWTIGAGLPGTSMPGYGDLLSPETIAALARHVLAFAPAHAVPGAPLASAPSAAAEAGSTLYARAGCPECHGPDGRGSEWRLPPAPPGTRAPGASLAPVNLAEPWTFRGGSAVGDVAQRILTGIDGSPMPAYAGVLSPAEARAIATHVASLARRPLWEEDDPARIARAGVAADPWERGRYLVNAMLCPLCHTPISAKDGAYDTAKFLAGGMRVSAYPWGVWYSRNLTGDAETGLGRWSEADIVRALTRGIARDGRRLDPMAMPWPWFTRLSDADAHAVAVYLKSLAPNVNAVPRPRRPSLPEQAGGKLLALFGMPVAVEFWGGNAAVDPVLQGDPPAPRHLRAWAGAIGWGALAALCSLLVVGALRRRRALAGAAGLVLVAWVALAVWPPLRLMTPEMVARWLLMGTPRLPAALSGADRARALRGEYAATIAPCGLCHTPAGAFVGFYTSLTAAGGMQSRWRVYGSVVSSNLTPHAGDGIGQVGDAALLRAMRSGIGRDGRALHWQAMPWDIGSAWSLEDQRAMLSYFRALPGVAGRILPPRPPRPGDPPADSFYFGDAARR
jgi:cytochrome c oxidase cbb3-type subunit 2